MTDLEKLNKWSHKWIITFNIDKYEEIRMNVNDGIAVEDVNYEQILRKSDIKIRLSENDYKLKNKVRQEIVTVLLGCDFCCQ